MYSPTVSSLSSTPLCLGAIAAFLPLHETLKFFVFGSKTSSSTTAKTSILIFESDFSPRLTAAALSDVSGIAESAESDATPRSPAIPRPDFSAAARSVACDVFCEISDETDSGFSAESETAPATAPPADCGFSDFGKSGIFFTNSVSFDDMISSRPATSPTAGASNSNGMYAMARSPLRLETARKLDFDNSESAIASAMNVSARDAGISVAQSGCMDAIENAANPPNTSRDFATEHASKNFPQNIKDLPVQLR